jgi:hypothetical protein
VARPCMPRYARSLPREFVSHLPALDLAKGEGALPALIAAQRRRAASPMAFRPAALSLPLPVAGLVARAGAGEGPESDLGGRPRLLVGPCRASIARDS